MEQTIREYGHFVIDFFVIVFAFGVAFGILDVKAQDSLHMSDANYKEYVDFAKYRVEAVKGNPEIRYSAVGGIQTGTHILTDYIKATDYATNEIPVKIIRILGPEGAELVNEYDEIKGEITLSEAGIYTVEVQAIDKDNRKSIVEIKLPVGEG